MAKVVFTQEQLFKIGLIPDGQGGYRKATKEELESAKNVSKKKTDNSRTKNSDWRFTPMSEVIGKSRIYIPGEVRSSKNSKSIITLKGRGGQPILSKKTGKPIKKLINSEAVEKYKKETAHYYEDNRGQFLKLLEGKEKPYMIEFLFIRSTMQRWDFSNMVQLVQDLMKYYGWITDDCSDIMFPIPPLTPPYYIIDNTAPGLLIRVL